MARCSYIYRKSGKEIRIDDPNGLDKAFMFLKGYRLKNVVNWELECTYR